MKWCYRVFVVVLLFSLMYSLPVFSQAKESMSLGINVGRTNPDTDFGRRFQDGDIAFSAFLRYPMFGAFHGQVNATFGAIKGKGKGEEFRTEIIPIDFRLLFAPFNFDTWSFYVYGGAGALYYDNKELPPNSNLPKENSTKGWTAVIPAGAGLLFWLDDRTALEFSGGYNQALNDKLNGFERENGKNDGWWYFSAGISVAGESGDADPDMDGLINRIEGQIGTDKHNPDTDGDGLNDGDEFNRYNSDPLNPDTDADGLSDGEEVHTYATNPNKADSDDEGLNDYDEVMTHKTDPNKADSDGDKLSDYEEIMTYKSDPLDPDMDKDELLDGDEVAYKSDMNNPDSDGEGLKDGEEVHTYKTDPVNKDTDGGTVDDYTEVKRGTDPLDPSDDVVEVGVSIVLSGVTFATGSAEITPESETKLNEVLEAMQTYPDIEVEIRGYTDNTGSKAANVRLSQRRAESVRNWLISKGIDGTRITAKGYGPDNPIAPNNTPEGRAKNRRIEFVRIK